MDMPADSAASRGDKTREALVRAAIDAFGRHGFSAASTRAIADAAGVNQALIGYHFGGKPGLYDAALEQIAAGVRQRMQPLVETIDAELGLGATLDDDAPAATSAAAHARPDRGARERHLAALHRLLDGFVRVVTGDESAPWARLILREQQDPSRGFGILYGGIMAPMFRVTATLVGRILDSDADAPDTRLLVTTILAQALVFRVARAAVMRQMAWTSVGAAEVAAIQARIRRNVTAILEQEIRA